METLLRDNLTNSEAAISLAKLPTKIRGFGPVKKANYEAAMLRREELLRSIREEKVNSLAAE